MRQLNISKYFLLLAALILLGCATVPPQNTNNICSIFQQYPKWYWNAQDAEAKWGVPMSVSLAIMYQESSYQANNKPPRTKVLGFIPWARPSSAYGYCQATDDTWRAYKKAIHSKSANRNDFDDAINFIGWYATEAKRRASIQKGDAYNLYLAYHEGIGGYLKKTYLKKPWLINVAKAVDNRAWTYHKQLLKCKDSLPKKHWWN
jgi:hypothetical protein